MNNDRFNFRFWNKRTKRYELTTFVISRDGDVYCWGSDVAEDDIIVYQCTGIRDANNILIYEGDIVQTITGAIGDVRWLNSGFVAVYSGNLITFSAVCGTMKVVGNIHDKEVEK